MTDRKTEALQPCAPRRHDARHDRLKLKLRENLKRRKSQIKQRSRTAEPSSDGHQTSPEGEVGKTDA
jgi:hypothetical protein